MDRRRRDETDCRGDERAMTEVLGHILVFSVIVASIGLIVATGLAGLEDTRESERFQNADRAFDVLAENMASVYERDVPSRATEIAVGGGQILYADPVQINVSVDDGSVLDKSYTLRPIEFRVDSGQSIFFEGGAVIRAQSGGGYMVEEPPFLLSDESIHVPVVLTAPSAERSIGGSTVLIRGVATRRSAEVTPGNYDNITIDVTSPRAEQWRTYFDDSNACSSITSGSGSVECRIEGSDLPTQTYVTLQRIRVSLDT
jgi:hypothetical protein